jgi:hypothetical protein
MMQGKLGELKAKRTKLQIKGKGLCNAIRPVINPVMLEIEDMEIAAAAQQMDELVMVQGELLTTDSQIKKLEAALGQ